MKKRIMVAAIGSAAMLQACSVSAIDTDALANNGLKVDYGIEMNVPGSALKADYNLEVAADKTEKMSVGAVITNGGETIDLKLEDAFIVNTENFYVNVKEAVDTVEAIAGEMGISDLLTQIGITEEWVSLPLPAFEKLGIKVDPESVGAVPEVSEELLNDFMSLAVVFAPEETDGVVTFKIDNEKILECAKQFDEFFANHKEEILKMGTPSVNSGDMLKDLDLKAPFEAYINAVGAGIAQATGMEEADAVAQINALVDEITAQIVEAAAEASGQQIPDDALDSVVIYDAVAEALEGQDILISLSYDDNSAEAVWRVDNAETYIVDAAVQEDGTIKVDLQVNEDVVATGTIEATEKGIKGVLHDPNGEGQIIVDVELTENGLIAVLSTDPESPVASFSVEVGDGSVNLSAEAAGNVLALTATGKAGETSGEGSLRLDINANGEEGFVTGYITYEIPSTPITIEIPVASDGLEVIKNVVAMIFASQGE